MGRDINESLTQLKELSGLDHIADNPFWKSVPSWENVAVTRYQEKARKQVECKNALEGFRSMNEQRAETHYAALKRQNPVNDTYDRILEKLHKIFALPGKLDTYIKTPTVDQAQDIKNDCRSILYDYDKAEFYPLFKTNTYLNAYGTQKIQPEYGKWTYNTTEYEMETMIKRVQTIME